VEILVVASVLGVVSAVAAVLAIWLALGSGRAIWRAILAIAGASGVAIVFCAVSGEAEAEWLVLLWVVVATITALFMLVRIRGYKLVDAAGNRARSDELQFSVTQLLALTAVVAVVAAVARLLAPIAITVSAIAIFLPMAMCFGALALVAVWATLRSEITRIKTLTLLIVTILMAGLTYFGMEVTNADPGAIWSSTVIAYSMALIGSLLLVRARRFRLVHMSELGQQQSAINKVNIDASLLHPVK
jgi:hypothetical protein